MNWREEIENEFGPSIRDEDLYVYIVELINDEAKLCYVLLCSLTNNPVAMLEEALISYPGSLFISMRTCNGWDSANDWVRNKSQLS